MFSCRLEDPVCPPYLREYYYMLYEGGWIIDRGTLSLELPAA